jgi:hypothetical protein
MECLTEIMKMSDMPTKQFTNLSVILQQRAKIKPRHFL